MEAKIKFCADKQKKIFRLNLMNIKKFFKNIFSARHFLPRRTGKKIFSQFAINFLFNILNISI